MHLFSLKHLEIPKRQIPFYVVFREKEKIKNE